MSSVSHRQAAPPHLWPSARHALYASTGVVAATLAFGAWGRVWELGKRGLWWDELSCVVGAATAESLGQLQEQWIDVDGHPPGYMLLLYGWFKLVPATEISARIPSCINGLFAIALILLSIGRRLPRGAAFYAAAIYALASEWIYYAQTVRQYSFLVTCSLGAIFEWIDIYSSSAPKRSAWIRVTAWLLAAAYMHYLAVLLAIAIFAVGLLRALRRRRGIYIVIASGLVYCVAYLPAVLGLLRKVGLQMGHWQSNDPLMALAAQYLQRDFFGRLWWLPVFAIAVFGSLRSGRWRFIADPRFQAIASILCVLVALFAVLTHFNPFLQLRYLTILYAPLLLIVAFVLSQLAPVESIQGTVVLVALAISGLASYSDYRLTQKQDWRRSAALVASEHAPGDVVYVLGADPEVAPVTYLQRAQYNEFFYCRDLPFYAYYFRRLSAPSLAAALKHLSMQPEEAERTLIATHAPKIFVLAPHHLHLQDTSLKRLKKAGFRVDDILMFSTHLYRLQRRGAEIQASAH